MRFSFKKTLALVLSVILVLSTFVGVLTTSAADATVVGTLTMEDVTVTANNDNTFAVPADITLTEEATYVEVAYQLGTLPEGVTLTSAALSTATDLEGSAVVDADKNVVHVSVPGPATTIPVVMTFTAANVLEAFELSITSVDYADVSEADKTITISDTAVITVAVHAVSDTMYSGDATYHWYTCTVDGCEDHKYYYDSKGVLHSGITWHSWIVDEKTAPTCSTAGVGYKYCSCGRVWGNVSIDATGEHDYSYLDNEDGATHTATCSVGGEVITDEAHTFVDGICSLCNAEEVCVHANTTSVVATPSDCINMGWTTYTCSDCGESWNAQDVAINPDVHTGNEATPIDKNDGTHDVPCADCSAVIRNEAHSFVDGTCACDAKEVVDCQGNHTYASAKENVTDTTFDSVVYCSACRLEIARYTIDIPQGAVLDENIVPSAHTTSVGETVGIGFRAKLSSLPTADTYKLYVVRYNNAGSYMFGTTSETLDMAGKSASNDFVAFKTYYGIELYSFTVPITYMVLSCDADGNVLAYSNPFTTTVEEICENYHNLSSTGDAAKKLHADLINLAAATQEYFVYRNPNSDYATKLVMPSFESAYASTEISGALANYDSKSGIELTVTTAIGQNPYFNIRFSGNIANKANYYMKVSFYNKIKKDTIVTTIDGSTFKGNASVMNGTFEALPLYAGDADVTIELYENGNDTPIGIRHFCLDTHISTYLSDNAGSTNQTTILLMNIWDAAAKYGQAHRALRNIPYVPATE